MGPRVWRVPEPIIVCLRCLDWKPSTQQCRVCVCVFTVDSLIWPLYPRRIYTTKRIQEHLDSHLKFSTKRRRTQYKKKLRSQHIPVSWHIVTSSREMARFEWKWSSRCRPYCVMLRTSTGAIFIRFHVRWCHISSVSPPSSIVVQSKLADRTQADRIRFRFARFQGLHCP